MSWPEGAGRTVPARCGLGAPAAGVEQAGAQGVGGVSAARPGLGVPLAAPGISCSSLRFAGGEAASRRRAGLGEAGRGPARAGSGAVAAPPRGGQRARSCHVNTGSRVDAAASRPLGAEGRY